MGGTQLPVGRDVPLTWDLAQDTLKNCSGHWTPLPCPAFSSCDLYIPLGAGLESDGTFLDLRLRLSLGPRGFGARPRRCTRTSPGPPVPLRDRLGEEDYSIANRDFTNQESHRAGLKGQDRLLLTSFW